MTATSYAGAPLIIAVLALGVSFLSAIGSIAAVLVARANLQRQIQATGREAWMREFREQVAVLLSAAGALRVFMITGIGVDLSNGLAVDDHWRMCSEEVAPPHSISFVAVAPKFFSASTARTVCDASIANEIENVNGPSAMLRE